MKFFPDKDLLNAYNEAAAYAALKSVQGNVVPFCYGIYDVNDNSGVVMLLAQIRGITLFEFLQDVHEEGRLGDLDRIKGVFQECWHAMEQLHECGWAHRDLKGENIILLKNGQAVFVDLENAK
jgi:serine/threonine protein kinase